MFSIEMLIVSLVLALVIFLVDPQLKSRFTRFLIILGIVVSLLQPFAQIRQQHLDSLPRFNAVAELESQAEAEIQSVQVSNRNQVCVQLPERDERVRRVSVIIDYQDPEPANTA